MKQDKTSKTVSFLLITSLLGVLLLGTAGFASAASDGTSSFNNVQIFIQTQKNLADVFIVSAYNSSGGLAATSQTQYPAASFELPSGTYLFVVSAVQSSSTPYPYPYVSTGYASSAGPVSSSKLVESFPPYYWNQSSMEYGYSVQEISNSTTLNMTTQPLSDTSTAKLKINVSYANGTAAQGVSVSSAIVGAWYWWGYDQKLAMWNQTDSSGQATLIVPSVPIEVSAWTWLPVIPPKNVTTYQTTIAGEPVNITAYWQPMYLGLAGSVLIIPPRTAANITLHAQQPDYWVMSYGVQSTGVVMGVPSQQGTIATGPTGVPASQYYQSQNRINYPYNTFPFAPQTQIPALTTTSTTTKTTTATQALDTTTLVAVAAIVSVVVASLSLVLVLRYRK